MIAPTKRAKMAIVRNWVSGDRCRRREICRGSCAIKMLSNAYTCFRKLGRVLQPIIGTCSASSDAFYPKTAWIASTPKLPLGAAPAYAGMETWFDVNERIPSPRTAAAGGVSKEALRLFTSTRDSFTSFEVRDDWVFPICQGSLKGLILLCSEDGDSRCRTRWFLCTDTRTRAPL